MQIRLRLVLVAMLLSSTSLTSAYSQTPAKTTTAVTDEVTVYATRSQEPTFTVPAMVSVIDASKPGNSLAGTTGELLQYVPGVAIDNGPRRSSQIVTIRGFDDEAILTLVDGRRQNFESGHDGRFFIDPSLLKSVEIVKGASSSIYGGGAIGGVVAFETKDASDLLAPGETTGAITSIGYRSATGELAPSVSGFARSEDWDVLANLNYRRAGDIDTGNEFDLIASDDIYSGLLKAGYTFNDFHTIRLNLQALNHDGQEPSNSGGTFSSTSNPVVEKKISDRQVGLKYEFDGPDSRWLKPKVHLYRNVSEVEEKNLTGTSAGRVRSREMTTDGIALDNQSLFSHGADQTHTVSYGLEFYKDEQVGYSSTGTYGGVPDADGENFGLYLQDNIEVATSVGKFSLIPAVRFDSYTSGDDSGNSQDESAVSPKFALSYQPTEEYMLFGSLAQAFRAPNLTEIYADGLHFFGNNFIQNPDLKPETVTTLEFGGGLDFKDLVAAKDRLRLKGSYFYSEGKDYINQVVGATTTQYVNVPNAVLYGWELEGSYQSGPATADMGLAFSTASNGDTGADLDSKEPLVLTTGLAYQISEIESVVGWRAKFSTKNESNSSSTTSTAGYSVHDVFYRYAPEQENLGDLTVDLGVENIFDKSYTASFSTLYEEGRSYTAKVTYKW